METVGVILLGIIFVAVQLIMWLGPVLLGALVLYVIFSVFDGATNH